MAKPKINVGTTGYIDHESSFNFDLERMKEAVNSPKIQMPEGLTRDQKRKFIIDACGLGEDDEL